jgi:hypothetical protein
MTEYTIQEQADLANAEVIELREQISTLELELAKAVLRAAEANAALQG